MDRWRDGESGAWTEWRRQTVRRNTIRRIDVHKDGCTDRNINIERKGVNVLMLDVFLQYKRKLVLNLFCFAQTCLPQNRIYFEKVFG
jgi:hypothetical protein